jgi:pimeloyl-ACP methyl ester carboxylesterase
MMRILRLLLLVFPLLILAACGSDVAQQPAQVATPTPTLIPIPTTPNIPARSVSFTTEDHVKLVGQLYGQGKTMVICSHMKGTSLAVWRDSGIPQRLAAQGYQVLLYDFRGNGGSDGEADTTMLDVDLNAAVNFAHKQGATKYVLMGASMGGTASLNVAVKGEAAALISVSAPQALGVNVTDADLKEMKVPKLFIASEDDEPYVTDAKHMYEIAHSPKEIALYPGTDHGTEIFGGNNGDAPAQRILHFIAQYAPAN